MTRSQSSYFDIWKQYFSILNLSLTADSPITFSLTFEQYAASEFAGNGNSGEGKGHIASQIPCTVEIIYMGKYKIKLTVNYGGGDAVTPNQNSQYVNFVAAVGGFDYTFNEKSSAFTVKAYAGNNYASTDLNGGLNEVYTNQYKQLSFTLVETLSAGTNYPFTLTFDQENVPGIVS